MGVERQKKQDHIRKAVMLMTNIISLCIEMFFGCVLGIVITLVIIGDKL